MVLGKRMLGVPQDVDETARGRFDDGSPQTFPQLLDDIRRSFGDKVIFQHKVRRDW